MNAEHTRWSDLKAERSGTEAEHAISDQTEMALQIGRRLYQRRTALGLSRSSLAQSSEVSARLIERLELGDISIRFDALERLHRALGLRLVIDAIVPDVA